jgi:hypothetical protein
VLVSLAEPPLREKVRRLVQIVSVPVRREIVVRHFLKPWTRHFLLTQD